MKYNINQIKLFLYLVLSVSPETLDVMTYPSTYNTYIHSLIISVH